jgi:hypothetical protein
LPLAAQFHYDRDAAHRLLQRYGDPGKPRKVAGEHLFYNVHDRVEALLSPQLAKHGLIVTKRFLVDDWYKHLSATTSLWHVYCWAAPNTHSYFRHAYELLEGRLLFVGDLRPHGLVQYLALRLGPSLDGPELPLGYGGIDSEWLAGLKTGLKRRSLLHQLTIDMRPSERSLFRSIESVCDVPALLGDEAYGLLRDGTTLHLEAVTGAHVCRRRFIQALVSRLEARANEQSHTTPQ